MVRRRMQVIEEETISVKLEEFIEHCKAEGKSNRTLEQYEKSVRLFIEVCGDLIEIGDDDILRFTQSFNQSPGGINYYLRGLRTFLNYCKLGIKVPLVKENKKAIIPFTDEQVKKIFNQIDRKTFVGERDYVMFQLLYDTGMRISELCGICKKDILKGYIIVSGKGNKERVVPIGEHCQGLLRRYERLVADLKEDEPIFVTENNLPMQRHVARQRLKKYAVKAGIKGVRVSPHTFRHTFARNFLINGGNMYALQAILGHESLEMVKRYVKFFEQDIITAHHSISPADKLFKQKERRKKPVKSV